MHCSESPTPKFFSILFVFISLPLVKGWEGELPFHATPLYDNNAYWVCNSGFFKTFPVDLSLSTCKRCSPLNVSHCPHDSALSECNSTQDAVCQRCSPLPQGLEYAPDIHDCQTKQCLLGFFNQTHHNTSSLPPECVPCPRGSFCPDRMRVEPCGDGVTTLAEKEFSPLACVPTQIPTLQEIHVIISFSFHSTSSIVHPFCTEKNLLFSQWLEYGTLMDCTARQQGEINCVILIAKRFTQEYLIWLYSALEIHHVWMQKFLLSCIQMQDAVVASWDTQVIDSLPSSEIFPYYFNAATNSTRVNDIPIPNAPSNGTAPQHIFTHHLHWGNRAQDIAYFILSSALLSSSMCLASALLLSGIIIRNRKQRKIRETLIAQTILIKSQL